MGRGVPTECSIRYQVLCRGFSQIGGDGYRGGASLKREIGEEEDRAVAGRRTGIWTGGKRLRLPEEPRIHHAVRRSPVDDVEDIQRNGDEGDVVFAWDLFIGEGEED